MALFECAVDKRSARIEREEAEVRRIAESRRKEELRKLQEQERTRLAQLLKDVDAWHQSQKIRAYADAVEAHAEKNEGSDSCQELMRVAGLPWNLPRRIEPVSWVTFALIAPEGPDTFRFRARGLDPGMTYRVSFDRDGTTADLSGSQLMHEGIPVRLPAMADSELLLFELVK